VCQDVKAEQVRCLLEYMYKGEVSVGQEELPALLRVAELLRVKGMVEENEEEEERHPLNSNTPVVKKEAKEPTPPTPANNRPRTSSPAPPSSAHASRSSSPLRSGDNGGGQLMLPAIPTTSSASSNNSNPALTPTSGGSGGNSLPPPPPHHLPPNFRPFLSSPGGPGGPSHTPPFPMWPLPGLFPGAHNLFSSPRGEGAGRAGSPGLKESSSARHRLNSGQDKEQQQQHQLAIPPLMPRDSLEEKQVGNCKYNLYLLFAASSLC
jgi:hypothetical protein